MTVKLRLAAVASAVSGGDGGFHQQVSTSVLADGVLVVGIVVVLFPLVKSYMPGS
ncbi:DUF3927 family protein [Escherichia coli]